MKTMKLFVLAAVLAASPACKKKPTATTTEGSGSSAGSSAGSSMAMGSDKPAEGSGSSMAMGSDKPAEGSGSGSAAMPMPVETADYIDVSAEHKKKKDTDPVVVHFEKFKVTKATFDPAKIEGGTASIEVDLASLKSGSDKRDEHLKSDSYFNVGKLATMTIDVGNVKKKDGQATTKTYTADAKVKLHGVEKKYPITFEVVDAKDDWIKIKGEHKLPRTDFKIGKDPKDENESVATDVTVKVALTLKKT